MGISVKTKQELEEGRVAPNQLFDTMASCEFLGGISPRTMLNIVQRGEIKPVKIMRRTMFRYRDLCALAKRGTK